MRSFRIRKWFFALIFGVIFVVCSLSIANKELQAPQDALNTGDGSKMEYKNVLKEIKELI